jgi:hypothetical protein
MFSVTAFQQWLLSIHPLKNQYLYACTSYRKEFPFLFKAQVTDRERPYTHQIESYLAIQSRPRSKHNRR